MKKLPTITAILIILNVSAVVIFAGPDIPLFKNTQLSGESKDTFQKGILAAEQKAFDLAIKYFTQVQEKEPFYAPVYFNLGLASSNMGLPLKAIAYFKAYLAGMPNASNKKQIEDEIKKLEVAAQIKQDKLLKQAIEAARTLPETGWEENQYADGGKLATKPRQNAFQDIYRSYGICGDMDGADKISRMTTDMYYQGLSYARRFYAEKLISEGSVDEALKEVQKIDDASTRSYVLREAVRYYIDKKNYIEAYKVIKLVGPDYESGEDSQLAIVLFEGGNTREALEVVDKWQTAFRKLEIWNEMIKSYLAKGKEKEAKDLIEKSYKLAVEKSAQTNRFETDDFENSYSYFASPLMNLGKHMISVGDIVRAEAVLDLWSNELLKGFLQSSVANYYAQKGDSKKADEWISRINDTDRKMIALHDTGTEFIKQGNWEKAAEFLEKIYTDSKWDYSAYPASFAIRSYREFRAGNLAEANDILNGISSDLKDRVIYEMVGYACVDKNFEKAKELASGFANQYWRKDAFGKIVFQCIEQKEFDVAYSIAMEKWDDLKFENAWGVMNICARLLKNNRREAALEILKKYEPEAYKKGDIETLEEMAGYYKDLGFSEGYNRIKSVISVFTWVGLAKKSLVDLTAEDMQIALQKKTEENAYKAPSAIAWMAEDLAKGARLIKSTQLTNRL